VTAWIDGRAVEPAPGESILEAARRIGVEIPTLCHVDGLPPPASCRVCAVEIEGAHELAGACHTPLLDGAHVRTRTPRLHALRGELIAMLDAQARVPAPAGTAFATLAAGHGVTLRGGSGAAARALDESHPYLAFDADRCIVCRRCVVVCDEIPARGVWQLRDRGDALHVACDGPGGLAESSCVACGACVDACPTRAIDDRDRRDAPAPETRVRTTCGYCGVGCQLEVGVANGCVARIDGVRDAAVNRGALCAKGRYAHAWQRSPERLTTPLLRRGEALEPVSWADAVAWLAGRLGAIHRAHGGDALGVLTSSRSTNEAAYLLQKLFRARFGSNHVDCCARVCHSSTALALAQVTGASAASASYDDVERARLLVVAGANATEAHPVLGARLLARARAGVPLLVVDPRRTELAEAATLHLALRPGSNVALFDALAKRLLESGRFDAEYVAERCDGLASLQQMLAGRTLEEASLATGVAADALERAAALLAERAPALFVSGLGLSEQSQGVGAVRALANLALLTGSIGRAGAGVLPLRGQNNVQGNADMGSMPDRLTGYQLVSDPDVRARFASLWGGEPPASPGLTLPLMLEAARSGRLRALWIQGEDVAQSDPDETRVLEALEALDLLVVQELFLTETARRAHLVLPAAGFLEQDGTFTNAERRIQRVRRAVAPPGEARADWEVIRDVGAALGLAWKYESPADVLAEIARAAPHLFGGVAWDRLDANGLQWPCPTREHPGTATVHEHGFLRGRALLSCEQPQASPESPTSAFPFALITGRVRQHYNVGTMTRRTPQAQLVEADRLELNPADAARLGISEGQRVSIESRHGEAAAVAHVTPRVAAGTLFLSFHFPETHANRAVGPSRDPESHCPEYKLTAVRVRAL
jgi:formate dehydrogenase alpha subunit